MIAFLLTLGTFFAFWAIGLAVLVAVRADTAELRIVLTAPVVGSAAVVLPLFMLSNFGAPMKIGGPAVVVPLLVGSAALLALRRPRLPSAVAPVLGLCVAGLLLAGWPLFEFGFRWIANANDDMANYVLSATKLLDGGLVAPLDVAGLSEDRNYDSGLQVLYTIGARPGADITLAAFSAVTGRPPYELFMPLILALHLCVVCGAAALAMQASRKWWAASVAAALLVVSPLATYGVVQQLLPQVWGLALAAALFALLLRPELHRGAGPSLREVVPIGLLAAGLVAVYVELASTLVLAYALYVAILAFRREIGVKAVVRLLGPALALVAVGLNTYLIREVEFVLAQAGNGLSAGTATPFGFALVPAALPAILGLQPIAAGPTDPYLAASILIAAVLLAAALVAALLTAGRGAAASVILVTYIAIGVLLHVQSSDFGLFKLYMYVQPFLAAAAGVWIAKATRRLVLAVVAVPFALLVAAQLYHQYGYVDRSRDPVDLRHASARSLLPAFRGFFTGSGQQVISVTEHPTLAKLEAAAVGERPLHLVSRNILDGLRFVYPELQGARLRRDLRRLERLDGWKARSFDLRDPSGDGESRFSDNTYASELLSTGRCEIILPTGTQLALNRLALPEGSPDLVARRCLEPRNLLAFTESSLGQSYYPPFTDRKAISFYQLEPDYFFSGRTLTGFGRHALFRVLGPSDRFRLELDLTTTLRQDGSNRLPPAAAVGVGRTRLPLLGRGSARVFSPPLRPQLIGGQPYVLLDMGVDGRISRDRRSGLEGLYGSSVPLDLRYLTSYVRNISLVSEAQYRNLAAPSSVRDFPADLADPGLEYSGVYEDGWTGESSYLVFAGGGKADLVVRAEALSVPGQRLQVLVNGRGVASRKIAAGALELRVPLAASSSRRRVELRWTDAIQLGAKDRRRAAALLDFIGVVPRGGG